MSLIAFHRILIYAAIIFCLGFSGWEIAAFRRSGDPGDVLMAATFGILGLALVWYLWKLNRFLGYEQRESQEVP